MTFLGYIPLLLLIVLPALFFKIMKIKAGPMYLLVLALGVNSLYQLFATALYQLVYLVPGATYSTYLQTVLGDLRVLFFLLFAFITLGGEIGRYTTIKMAGVEPSFLITVIYSILWLVPYSLNIVNWILIEQMIQSLGIVSAYLYISILLTWSIGLTLFATRALYNTKFVLFSSLCFFFVQVTMIGIFGDSSLLWGWPSSVLMISGLFWILYFLLKISEAMKVAQVVVDESTTL